MEEELKKVHDEVLENLKEAFGERLDGAVGDIDPRLMDRWIVTTNPDPLKSGFSTKYVANIQMFAYSYKRDANDTEGCTNE